MLLVSDRHKGYSLFVFLGQKHANFKAYKLGSTEDISILEVMGIGKVTPGAYTSACGKGYWACSAGEPPKLLLKNDAVEYFKEASAAAYWYWDARKKRFRRAWISD